MKSTETLLNRPAFPANTSPWAIPPISAILGIVTQLYSQADLFGGLISTTEEATVAREES